MIDAESTDLQHYVSMMAPTLSSIIQCPSTTVAAENLSFFNALFDQHMIMLANIQAHQRVSRYPFYLAMWDCAVLHSLPYTRPQWPTNQCIFGAPGTRMIKLKA